MSDRDPTCPLCGAECKSRSHVRQHLHTDHRKFELIDACVGGDDGVASGSADRAGRAVVASRPR